MQSSEPARFDHHGIAEASLPPRTFVLSEGPTLAILDRNGSAESSLTTLATGLGHDIGNIVLPILCHLDSLEAQNLPQHAQKDVRALRESAMHLKRLSASLNLLAHEPGEREAGARTTRFEPWWKDINRTLKRLVPAGVLLEFSSEEPLPPIRISPQRLTHAISNLIANSVEAISGTGKIRIWGRTTDDGKSVQIGVSDNGRGMADDVRQHAAEPFFTTKKRSLSTGLGLTQVQNLVRSAGGTVQIDSAPQAGSTVILTLPAAAEDTPSANGVKRSASIVLTDARIAAFAKALLECTGFSVHPPGESDEVLLVTEPTANGLDAIRDFVRTRPGRRAIVVGKPAETWDEPGVTVIEPSYRALQRELQRAASEVT